MATVKLDELYIISPSLRDKLLAQAKKSGGWQQLCGGAVSRPLLEKDVQGYTFRLARKQFLLRLREEIDAELTKPEYR